MKLKLVFILALVLCSFSVAAWAVDPFQFDLIDLKFGMTGDEAKALIEKKYPGFAISEFKTIEGTVGFKASDNADNEMVLVRFEVDTGVWLIARSQRFADGSRPTIEKVKESLGKKYGLNPELDHFGNISWIFDRDGKQLGTQQDIKTCGALIGLNSQLRILGAGSPITIPSKFPEPCGIGIRVNISTDSKNQDMVNSYSVTLTNGKIMYDKLSAKSAAAEKAEMEKLEKEKANSTDLDL